MNRNVKDTIVEGITGVSVLVIIFIIVSIKGVTIVTESSPLIEHLRDLEKMGVQILLCATCVNHYAIADIVGAGTLSNMYTIAEEMASAANIVRP
ncbi:MAG: hypothetical protein D4R64_05680 [Porphyromonadaceae bacterium]|nr:MAG: hypothetical protein D4R64_05680 [Porphyromonadaceae bacterium]